MMTDNKLLLQMSRESLKGKWALAIGATLVYLVIIAGINSIPIIGSIISLFLSGPLALGMTMFSLSISRNEDAQIEQIFKGFDQYTRTLVAHLVMILFIILWMLLLIVPGIIKALSFSMTFFVLVDDKEIPAMEAIKKSEQLMDGNKEQLFYLCLRFFGLELLCILTFGIGFLWLIPYIQITMAKFYEAIK